MEVWFEGDFQFRIHYDGTIEYGPEYTAEKTTKTFDRSFSIPNCDSYIGMLIRVSKE